MLSTKVGQQVEVVNFKRIDRKYFLFTWSSTQGKTLHFSKEPSKSVRLAIVSPYLVNSPDQAWLHNWFSKTKTLLVWCVFGMLSPSIPNPTLIHESN